MREAKFQVKRKTKTDWDRERFPEEFEITVKLEPINGIWTCQLGYGYNNRVEVQGRSGYLKEVLPSEGDIWFNSSGRRFRIGRPEGFMFYHAPLIDEATGQSVAEVNWELYNKD